MCLHPVGGTLPSSCRLPAFEFCRRACNSGRPRLRRTPLALVGDGADPPRVLASTTGGGGGKPAGGNVLANSRLQRRVPRRLPAECATITRAGHVAEAQVRLASRLSMHGPRSARARCRNFSDGRPSGANTGRG